MAAGILTMSRDTSAAVAGIAEGIEPALLIKDYPDAVSGLIKQHGFNLLWIGAETLVGGMFMWRGSVFAILISALVGGLADLGYFIFTDLAGLNLFLLGTVTTLISASAIGLSLRFYFLSKGSNYGF